MPKPYSLDLRERVVGFVEAGQSRHAAAAHFKVSVSFVVNLMQTVRKLGLSGFLRGVGDVRIEHGSHHRIRTRPASVVAGGG